MQITYTFTVQDIDVAARCATVLYESEGLPSHLISVRFPYSDEPHQEVIESYAPTYAWAMLKKDVVPFNSGYSGEITYDDTPPPLPPAVEVESVVAGPSV